VKYAEKKKSPSITKASTKNKPHGSFCKCLMCKCTRFRCVKCSCNRPNHSTYPHKLCFRIQSTLEVMLEMIHHMSLNKYTTRLGPRTAFIYTFFTFFMKRLQKTFTPTCLYDSIWIGVYKLLFPAGMNYPIMSFTGNTSDCNDGLAGVFSLQHPHKTCWHVLKAFCDVLPTL